MVEMLEVIPLSVNRYLFMIIRSFLIAMSRWHARNGYGSILENKYVEIVTMEDRDTVWSNSINEPWCIITSRWRSILRIVLNVRIKNVFSLRWLFKKVEKIFSKRIINLSLSMHNWITLVVLFLFQMKNRICY